MKKILLLMLGLAAGTASFAKTTDQNAPSATLAVTADKKLRLIISPEQAKALVILRDFDGHVLYKNEVSLLQGFSQQFNISELPLGLYQIAVSVGKESTVKTFEVGLAPAQTIIKVGS